MNTIITYTRLTGRNTRDILRHIHDIDLLREQVGLCWTVMQQQTDAEYTRIWTTPSKALPKKTVVVGRVYDLQSPREFLEGFKEKIERSRGRDLSPKQCEGFVNLYGWFSAEFGVNAIVFADKDELSNLPNLLLFEPKM